MFFIKKRIFPGQLGFEDALWKKPAQNQILPPALPQVRMNPEQVRKVQELQRERLQAIQDEQAPNASRSLTRKERFVQEFVENTGESMFNAAVAKGLPASVSRDYFLAVVEDYVSLTFGLQRKVSFRDWVYDQSQLAAKRGVGAHEGSLLEIFRATKDI
ncbi:MAG: hypothetical protein NTY48_01140 [Candidatus Diapherotrites archaeon]|nr:hypothetical protein [Candidatus Diapherotrites archaeon]